MKIVLATDSHITYTQRSFEVCSFVFITENDNLSKAVYFCRSKCQAH